MPKIKPCFPRGARRPNGGGSGKFDMDFPGKLPEGGWGTYIQPTPSWVVVLVGRAGGRSATPDSLRNSGAKAGSRTGVKKFTEAGSQFLNG